MDNLINIDELHKLCKNDTIRITNHTLLRCRERRIKYRDIVYAINNGEIIEQYPTDYPYPSCLLLNLVESGEALHVVCGMSKELLYIITAYRLSKEVWESDCKTRKGRKL